MKFFYVLFCLVVCSSLTRAQGFRQVYPPTPVHHVYALARWNGDTVYAAGSNSLFLQSTDAGGSWIPVFAHDMHYDFPRMGANAGGIWLLPAASSQTAGEFMDSTTTFLLHYNPVTRDTQRVEVPVRCRKPAPDYLPRDISVTRDAVFMLQCSKIYKTGDMALVRTVDNGATWQQIPLPTEIAPYLAAKIEFRDLNFGILAGYLLDSTKVQALFVTDNGGGNWRRIFGFGHPINTTHTLQCISDSCIAVLGDDGVLHISTDRGVSWRAASVTPFIISAFDFLPDGTGYASSQYREVAGTTDFGTSWTAIKTGDYSMRRMYVVNLCLRPDVFVYADADDMMFRTVDAGVSWDFSSPETTLMVQSMRFFDKNDGIISAFTNAGTEYHGTTDGGRTWGFLFHESAIGNGWVYPASAREFWAVRNPNQTDIMVYHSADRGASWQPCFTRAPGDSIWADYRAKGTFTRGTDSLCFILNTGIMRTVDRGKTWTIHPQVQSLFSKGASNYLKVLYACFPVHIWLGTPDRVLRSDDYGQTWTIVASLDSTAQGTFKGMKAVTDSIVYVMHEYRVQQPTYGTRTAYMRTTDAGSTWETYYTHGSFQYDELFTSLFEDGTGYASRQPGYGNEFLPEVQLYKTTDAWRTSSLVMDNHYEVNFQTWGNANYLTFFLDKDYGWAYLDALYRTTTGGIDWVRLPPPAAPAAWSLDEPYPNPTTAFTGATMEFTVNGTMHMPVTMELYDILGKRVATVYQGGFTPGRHAIHIPTTGLPPGVCVVRATANNAVQTKIIIVK